jgi:tetratricopeptide (TPR) repeat protein
MSLAVIFVSTTALAGARQHYNSGQDYYAQGRYEKAIEEFEEAYRLDRSKHLLLFNISQAYERMGALNKAVEYLKRYLKKDPRADNRVSLESKIANLEARIANTGVVVTSNQTGATIYVDDKKVGLTPEEKVISLQPGAHKVRVSKTGYKDFLINVGVSMGHSVPVEANFGVDPTAAAAAGTATAVGLTAAEKKRMEKEKAALEKKEKQQRKKAEKERKKKEKEERKKREKEEKRRQDKAEGKKKIETMDWLPWTVAGVGGAMAITGLAVMGSIALSNDDQDLALVADIVGWSGVAIAAGGIIWGSIHLAKKKKKATAETPDTKASFIVVPVVNQNGAGVAASVTF